MPVNDIEFVNESTGWLVGDWRLLRKTTDGGTTWESQTAGVNYHLYGITMFDENTGWIVGENGTIIHTTDGGGLWLSQESNTPVDLYDVFCTNALTCWVFGDEGLVLFTSDGGETWKRQNSHADQALHRSVFADPLHGWAVGHNGAILKYTGSESIESGNRTPLPQSIALDAFPNPFNSTTTLAFELPQAGPVSLQVFDISGRLIETLEDRIMPSGSYRILYDGAALASGIYFVRLQSHALESTRKIVLIK